MNIRIIFFLFVVCSFFVSQAHERRIVSGSGIMVTQERDHLKTTAVGDTIALRNITTDTLEAYYAGAADSGFVTGTNVYNDRGFAELYSFNANDSSLKVIGVVAAFTGSVHPASTHVVNFKVWQQGNEQIIGPHLFYSGFPGNCLDTTSINLNLLGIRPGSDTPKSFMFSHATPLLNAPFFVGYDIDYNFSSLMGDTIALFSSLDGSRTVPDNHLRTTVDIGGDTTVDTIINVQNATQYSDGIWHDNRYENFQLSNNLAIYPIVVIQNPTGVAEVSRGDLTVSVCYPNPASNQIFVGYQLRRVTNINIDIYDVHGRQVDSRALNGAATGFHTAVIDVSGYPQATYYYVIHTSNNEGIGGRFTVQH